MTTILCPDPNWRYTYGDSPEQAGDYIVEGETLATFSNTDKVKLSIVNFTEDLTINMYDVIEDGLSITDDNMVVFNLRLTSPPSFFEKCALYMEDCNGIVVSYSLDGDMIGKETVVLTKAIVAENPDFNQSYVTKVGFTFYKPASERAFTITVSDLHTVYRIQPTYAQPEEVIEFLGMVDNKGNLFKLTDMSVPSYNAIAKRIVEAEEFMESACRQAWKEKRIVGEMRNADVTWAATFGYMGILTAESPGMGAQMFFKGIPVKLTRDKIASIDYSKGDKVEVRRYGSEWYEVPESMIWSDNTKGIIYVKTMFFQKDASVRVTYRYGRGPVPPDIKQAVLLKTAMIIVGTDWYRQRFPQSPDFDPLKVETLNQWTWIIKDCIRNHTDLITCGSM